MAPCVAPLIEEPPPALDLPRLPVLGWSAFAGPARSTIPSILDRTDVCVTTSGRAAIALALRELGIGPRDRVLVPTYHCPTMIAPVVAAGATPVFYPIDGSGSPLLESADRARTTGARAMIAAHYFGLPQPMAKLRAFCDAHRIALIEDCAHALFGMSDGRPVGSWGDYAIASLTKFLPLEEGGCLVPQPTSTRALLHDLQALSQQLRGIANAVELGARFDRFPGINLALRTVFAGVAALRGNGKRADAEAGTTNGVDVARWLADFAPGSSATRRPSAWTRWIARHVHRGRIVSLRRRNYAQLVERTKRLSGARALLPILPDAAAPYVFPLWVDDPERIYQRVRHSGVPVFRWDEVWPGCPALEGDNGLPWATHIFQLGCHQDLAPDDLEHMVEALERLLADESGYEPDCIARTKVTGTTGASLPLARG